MVPAQGGNTRFRAKKKKLGVKSEWEDYGTVVASSILS